MDEMSQQGQLYFHSESIHFRGTNISEEVVLREIIDSHCLLDAYGNEMVYGMTQYDGVQHQPNLDMGVQVSSNSAASSSVAPPNARHTEIDIPILPRFGSWRSMMARDSNHLIQENYLGDQHFQPEAPLPPDQQLTSNNNNNGDHALAWYQSMSYVQAATPSANLSSLENAIMDSPVPTPSTNISSLENAIMDLLRYHDTAGSRSGYRFQHPVQESLSINLHPAVTAPSNRVPTNPSSRSSTPIQNAPFAGAHIHHPQPPRGNMHETTPGYWRNLPPETFLQDDDIPSGDHHSDMRLDIEDMSYEELLLLGERIGNVDTGLLEEIIARQMKTKTYLLPNNLEGSTSEEQETDLCIICQDEYKNKEEIGILQCGHGYHADCIRRWLHEKNVCPMCKSKALTIE